MPAKRKRTEEGTEQEQFAKDVEGEAPLPTTVSSYPSSAAASAMPPIPPSYPHYPYVPGSYPGPQIPIHAGGYPGQQMPIAAYPSGAAYPQAYPDYQHYPEQYAAHQYPGSYAAPSQYSQEFVPNYAEAPMQSGMQAAWEVYPDTDAQYAVEANADQTNADIAKYVSYFLTRDSSLTKQHCMFFFRVPVRKMTEQEQRERGISTIFKRDDERLKKMKETDKREMDPSFVSENYSECYPGYFAFSRSGY